jgi:uncharacterized protein
VDEATQALAKLIDGEALPAPLDSARERGNGALPGPLMFGLIVAFLLRALLGWLPMPARPVTMLIAGLAGAFAISGSLLHGVVSGVLSGLFGLPARDSGGGGGFGGGFPIGIGLPGGRSSGGWSGGGGGGGWSGGGGSSAGGGASGGW